MLIFVLFCLGRRRYFNHEYVARETVAGVIVIDTLATG